MAARYSYGYARSVMLSHEWRTVENSAAHVVKYLSPASRVLDVGCGPGTITADFAQRCPNGSVVGVDQAQTVVDRARSSFSASEHENLTFLCGSAYCLPFSAKTFDVVHCHQTLHHLSDPVAALKEMKRVCADGGVVTARESDYDDVSWMPRTSGLTQWGELLRQAVSRNGGQPQAARNLVGYAREAGFDTINSSASTWCFHEKKDREWWGQLWAARFREGPLPEQLLKSGVSPSTTASIEQALLDWTREDSGWFSVTFGEIVCRSPPA